MDRIFQMLHKFKIRVLPPQPDRVVVTDFVATTFCFNLSWTLTLEKTVALTKSYVHPPKGCV